MEAAYSAITQGSTQGKVVVDVGSAALPRPTPELCAYVIANCRIASG